MHASYTLDMSVCVCVCACVSVTNWVDWRVILDERCVSVESEVQWPEMASREVG